MTDLEKSKYFMAGVVTLVTVGILYILLFKDMPPGSKDVLNIGLGVLLGDNEGNIQLYFRQL